MIGNIISWLMANWATVSSIIGLLAGFVVAWKRGTQKADQAQAAKETAANIVETLGEMEPGDARRYVDEQTAVRAQAARQVRSERRRQLVRDRLQWWQSARKRIGKE